MRKSIRECRGALATAFVLLACGVLSPAVEAGSLTFTATSNGYAESPNGNGDYTSLASDPAGNLVVRQFPGAVQDVALMTFDLSSLPANATITGVAFEFYESVETGNSGTVVGIDGYSTTSSAVMLGDATAAGTQLGQYDNVSLGVGVHSVSLSSSDLLGLVSSGGLVGIRLQGVQDNVNTAISSIYAGTHFAGQIPPQLVVTFSVPEPSAAMMLGTSAVAGFFGFAGLRRTRR